MNWLIWFEQLIEDFFINVFHDPLAQHPSTLPMNMEPIPVIFPNPDTMLPWENKVGSSNNRHNVRVLADVAGLSLNQKNILTACIEQESDFYPHAVGKPNGDGTIDYGICQYNTGHNPRTGKPYWIGEGAPFASIQDVFDNPEKCVNLMISMQKAGLLHLWASFSTGAYLKYMPVV